MTIKELSEKAGVSISTVSKIMNGKDESISVETRSRVLELAKQYNYTPYAAALSASTKSLLLGVVFDSQASMRRDLNGILHIAQQAGYRVIVCVSDDNPDQEYRHISAMIKNRVDGVLWRPTKRVLPSFAASLSDAGIPYLIFNSVLENSINIDFHEFSYHATAYLADQGHTALGCLLKGDRPLVEADLAGFRQCLFDKQLPFLPENIYQGINQTLLDKISAHAITGLFISHYSIALELYEILKNAHHLLPYDISIVSLRDDSYYIASEPLVSSITIPHYEFGEFLCRKLISLIEHQTVNTEVFAPRYDLSSGITLGIPYQDTLQQVLVIGSMNIDNYLSFDQLPYSGHTVISHFPRSSRAGGKGLNQAVGAALLGHRVSLIGCIGNDVFSNMILSAVNQYHINPVGIIRLNGKQTGQAYIFTQPDGNSMISITSGANNALSGENIYQQEKSFQNAGICLIQTEIPLDAVIASCTLASKYKVPVILKPCIVLPLSDQLLAMIDYLVPNEDELNRICPQVEGTENKVDYLLAKGVKNIILTLGEKGCYLKNQTTAKFFPAAPFTSVDQTGASDAFISALASYLLYDYSLEDSIVIATYAAGFCITQEGVIPALVDKEKLESTIIHDSNAPAISWKG